MSDKDSTPSIFYAVICLFVMEREISDLISNSVLDLWPDDQVISVFECSEFDANFHYPLISNACFEAMLTQQIGRAYRT